MRLSFHDRPSLAFILTALTLFQGFGVYLFLKGFLLTRQTLDLPPLPLLNDATTTPFDRVLVIVIDALRFDFAIALPDQQEYYLNQLPVIDRLLTTHPESSLLFQFRADPPTTTMQRVKGLMTGSLPTFIDAGANFASSVVTEDHLLRQIRTRYKEIYFMGDDTWTNLFPDVLFEANKTFESDSFKMFDLDTVDNRILDHLWPLVDDTDSQWEVAIAHFLGVDHCGHTYGPSHPNMAIKLRQMNDIIERLVEKAVDDRTLLVVMGDHGMSVEGDHGGESVEELTSTLFMHSKRPLTRLDAASQALYHQLHQARAHRLGYDLKEVADRLQYDASQYPTVSQIHLVPTLAYLLGIPIPFGNLGALIPDVVVNGNEEPIRHMAEEFGRNARQVAHYLEEYGRHTSHPGFARQALEPIYAHLTEANACFAAGSFEPAIFAYDRFLTDTIKYCQAIWAQFDVGSMGIGILLLTATTCAAVHLSFVRHPVINWRRAVGLSIGTVLVGLTGAMIALADGVRGHGWFEKMSPSDGVAALAALAGCSVFIGAAQGKVVLGHDWSVILVGTLINALTLASNSFVVWEDRGTRFIAVTLCTWWFLRSLRTEPILIMAWIRLTGLVGQCREEQFPYCSYIHSGYLTRDNIMIILGFFILNLALLIYLIQLFGQRVLRATVAIACWKRPVYCAALAVVYLRQIQDIYDSNTSSSAIPSVVLEILNVYLPRLVYLICALTTTQVAITTARQCRLERSSVWTLIFFWSATLAMLQRPFSTTILLSVPIVIDVLTRSSSPKDSGVSDMFVELRLALLHMIGHHLFFATAHQATFTSLPWKAAFIGFDDMNYYGGALLVALSTLAGPLMAWISWPLFSPTSNRSGGDDQGLAMITMVLLPMIPTWLSALFVLILRRHLMTWKIFAPRYLLQALFGMGSAVVASVLAAATKPGL